MAIHIPDFLPGEEITSTTIRDRILLPLAAELHRIDTSNINPAAKFPIDIITGGLSQDGGTIRGNVEVLGRVNDVLMEDILARLLSLESRDESVFIEEHLVTIGFRGNAGAETEKFMLVDGVDVGSSGRVSIPAPQGYSGINAQISVMAQSQTNAILIYWAGTPFTDWGLDLFYIDRLLLGDVIRNESKLEWPIDLELNTVFSSTTHEKTFEMSWRMNIAWRKQNIGVAA